MTKFFLRWIINTAGLYAAVFLLPDRIELFGSWVSIIWLALIFGLVNALLRPLLKLLTCPLIVLTLGLFSLLINAFLFWLSSVIGQAFGIGLVINEPVYLNAFLGSLIVTAVSIVLTLFLKDELKGRHK